MSEVNFWIKKIEVKKSPIHGWGVFASETINKGEFFECSPFLRIHATRLLSMRALSGDSEHSYMILEDYYYKMGTNENPIAGIGWGYSSLYNHSKHPNAARGFVKDETVGKVIGLEYMALRDIEPGEEILVDYFNSGENVEFINEDLETPMEDFSLSPDLIEQNITRTID